MLARCVALLCPRVKCPHSSQPPIFVVPDRSVPRISSAQWPSATRSVINREEHVETSAELALQAVKRKVLSAIRGSVEPSVGGIGQTGTARTDRFPRTSAIVIERDVPVGTMVVVDPQKHTIQSVA